MTAPTEFAELPGDRLLTIAEAAKLLGVSPSAARRYAANGELPGALPKLGGRGGTWRVNESALREYLDSYVRPKRNAQSVDNGPVGASVSGSPDTRTGS